MGHSGVHESPYASSSIPPAARAPVRRSGLQLPQACARAEIVVSTAQDAWRPDMRMLAGLLSTYHARPIGLVYGQELTKYSHRHGPVAGECVRSPQLDAQVIDQVRRQNLG